MREREKESERESERERVRMSRRVYLLKSRQYIVIRGL